MGSALEGLGRVLEEVQGFREETLLHPLEDMFDPMEDFVKREVKTIRKVIERWYTSVQLCTLVEDNYAGDGDAFAAFGSFVPFLSTRCDGAQQRLRLRTG